MGSLKGLFSGGGIDPFGPPKVVNGQRVSMFYEPPSDTVAPAVEAPPPATLAEKFGHFYDKASEYIGAPKQALDLGVGLGADYLKNQGYDLGINTDAGNEAGQLLRKIPNPILGLPDALTNAAMDYAPAGIREPYRGAREGLLEKGSALASDPVAALVPESRLAAAAFLPGIVRGAGEQLGQAGAAFERGDYAEAAKQGAGGLVDTGFALLGGLHAGRHGTLREKMAAESEQAGTVLPGQDVIPPDPRLTVPETGSNVPTPPLQRPSFLDEVDRQAPPIPSGPELGYGRGGVPVDRPLPPPVVEPPQPQPVAPEPPRPHLPQAASEPIPTPPEPLAASEVAPAVSQAASPSVPEGEAAANTAPRLSPVLERRLGEHQAEIASKNPAWPAEAVNALAESQLARERHRLTGLPERELFDKAVESGQYGAYASADGRKFGIFNKTHGHPVGDAVIKVLGNTIADVAQRHGVDVFHTGGDEFRLAGKDLDSVRRAGAAAQEALRGGVIEHTGPDGKTSAIPLPEVDFGYGERFSDADAELGAIKLARKGGAQPSVPGDVGRAVGSEARTDLDAAAGPGAVASGLAEGRNSPPEAPGRSDVPADGTLPQDRVASPAVPENPTVPRPAEQPYSGNRAEPLIAEPEAQPAFSAASEPQGSPVTTEHVRAAFKAGTITESDNGWTVKLPGDRTIRVDQRGEIAYRPEALEKGHGAHAVEEVAGGTRRVVGSYIHVGRDAIIQLAKGADAGTLSHEQFHDAMALALSKGEREAVLRHYGDEEKAADAYSRWNPAEKPHGTFAKILNFFKGIYRAFRPSWESAFEAARSGEAYQRNAREGAGVESYAVSRKAGPGDKAAEPTPEPGGGNPRASVPTQDEIVSVLRSHPLIKLKEKVQRAFLVGSQATGRTRAPEHGKSDVDILLEVKPRPGVTPEQLENHYRRALQNHFVKNNIRGVDDSVHPQWDGHRVDVYFTYDANTETRPKILLHKTRPDLPAPPVSGEPKYATAPKTPPEPVEKKRGVLRPIPNKPVPVPERDMGRPMRPEEAHRVDTKVADLKEVAPNAKLERDAPRTWKSLDPQIRERLEGLRDPDKEAEFYQKAASGKINDVEVQTLDALLRGKKEAYETVRERLLKAREAGKTTGVDNTEFLKAAFDRAATELAVAAKSDVQAGTRLARALAARARVMEAAGEYNPQTALKRIFREFPGASEKQASELLRIMETEPQHLADAIQALTKPTLFDKFLEYRNAGLVSAPGTQFANVSGNSVEHGARVAETGLAAGIERLLTGGENRERFFGEVGAELASTQRAIGPALQNLRGELADIITLKPEKIDLSRPLERQVGAIEGKKGRFIRAPFRSLDAFDHVFQAVGGEAELGKLAYRKAAMELKNAPQEVIRRRAATILNEIRSDNSTQHADLIKQAGEAKQARVFRDEPWAWVKSLEQFVNKHKAMRLVLPFIRTPANIGRLTVQRSPLGFIDAANAYREYKAGKIGSGAASDRIARPLLGTTVLLAATAVAKGLIPNVTLTGSGPVDPREKSLLKDAGWSPYSFAVKGDDGKTTYVPFDRFEPISSILGFAADMNEAKSERNAQDVLAKVIGSAGENVLSKRYLEGLGNFASFISDPKGEASRQVRDFSGTLVPNIVAKATQAIDPTVRDTRPESSGLAGIPEAAYNTIAARIPGLAQTLPEKQSATGQTVERPGNAVSRFLSPIQVSRTKDDAALNELLVKIGYPPSIPKREVTVPIQGGKPSVKVRLSDEEYATLQEAQRRASDFIRRNYLNSRQFQNLPDTIEEGGSRSKEALVKRIFDQAHSQARKALPRLPSFRAKVTAARA